MAFRLKPKQEKFFQFLSNHAAIALQSAELLEKSICAGNRIYEFVLEIDEQEQQADAIIQEATRKLNKLFITPIDREDIHILMEKQDDVIDFIKAAVEKMHLYHVGFATEGMKELSHIVFKSVKQLDKAVGYLDNLKKNHLKLEARCNRIVALEAEGDKLYRREMAKLFRENINPIEIIKRKEVLTEMEDVLDLLEDIAKSLKRVVLKYA